MRGLQSKKQEDQVQSARIIANLCNISSTSSDLLNDLLKANVAADLVRLVLKNNKEVRNLATHAVTVLVCDLRVVIDMSNTVSEIVFPALAGTSDSSGRYIVRLATRFGNYVSSSSEFPFLFDLLESSKDNNEQEWVAYALYAIVNDKHFVRRRVFDRARESIGSLLKSDSSLVHLAAARTIYVMNERLEHITVVSAEEVRALMTAMSLKKRCNSGIFF
jgi:hypothetical protein